jgi:divalent metal cation (Fe/Co/Zn/Cd) transporter
LRRSQRSAQEALGDNSCAVHEAYAKGAQVITCSRRVRANATHENNPDCAAFFCLNIYMMTREDFVPVASRETDTRRGRRLEYFTLGWNLTEAVVGIGAGIIAGSMALVGFGLDSIIESFSGATLLWRLQSHEAGEKREQRALKLVGISFFVLAAYVAIDAAKTLVQREPPHASIVGVCLAAVSIVVMPLLARAKRRVAARLNSRALVADSRQTDLCAYLSGILFVGLILNALFGWWWADSIAAILMVPIITREGIEALRGDACDDCS